MKEKEEIIEINNGESHRVLELAMEAGRILLRNGAEIFRVEETVWHICEHYGVQGLDTFVLSNGIFITADDGEKTIYAKTKHVPLSGAHLGIVAEVNALSREIVEGKVSVDEAFQRLKEIEQMPRTSKTVADVCMRGWEQEVLLYYGGNFDRKWNCILHRGITACISDGSQKI